MRGHQTQATITMLIHLSGRHNTVSDLHRENLEAWRRKNKAAATSSGVGGLSYRDRAKERRQKYGDGSGEDAEGAKRNQ